MGGKEWAISLALGCVSLPLGALIRLIPNEPCERIFEALRLLPSRPPVLPIISPDAELVRAPRAKPEEVEQQRAQEDEG